MADRFGPRIILTRIVLWWSLFTALTGAVSSYPFLLLTRFGFGAGEAGVFPNAAASIASWFPANAVFLRVFNESSTSSSRQAGHHVAA